MKDANQFECFIKYFIKHNKINIIPCLKFFLLKLTFVNNIFINKIIFILYSVQIFN